MEQKKIDANLKAKARIEWINGVREKSSELISLLLSLQKEEIAFHEQWLKVEETSELLKLFFSSKTIKDIEKISMSKMIIFLCLTKLRKSFITNVTITTRIYLLEGILNV